MPRKIKQLGRVVIATGTATGTATVTAYTWTVGDPILLGDISTTQLPYIVDLKQYTNDPTGTHTSFSLTSVTPSTPEVTLSDVGVLSLSANTPTDSYDVVILLDTAQPSVSLPTLGVSGAGAWTFGQAFKQGDAPAYVTVAGGQGEVRNRWSDGSVKFAVLSGISAGAGSVQVITSGTNPMTSGTSVSEPTAGELASVSVVLTGDISETITIPVGATASFGANPTAHVSGKITGRGSSGPTMTEVHYYAKTSDPYLRVWFYVRKYVNGTIEVETCFENCWARYTTGYDHKYYGVTVNVGGQVVFSETQIHEKLMRPDNIGPVVPTAVVGSTMTLSVAAQQVPTGIRFYVNDNPSQQFTVVSFNSGTLLLTASSTLPASVTSIHIMGHPIRARWSVRGWINGSEVTPVRSAESLAYLMSTKMVPNYARPDGTRLVMRESALASFQTVAKPLHRGPFDYDASGAGYHAHIGLLPSWDAAYVVSGDSRLYRAVLAAEQSANAGKMGAAVYSHSSTFAIRDEETGLPLNPATYGTQNLSQNFSPDAGAGLLYKDVTKVAYASWGAYPSHGVSAGYLAYLLTGRWFSLETCQFNVCAAHFGVGSGYNGVPWYAKNTGAEERHIGWTTLHLAQATAITPDTHPMAASFKSWLKSFWGFWHTDTQWIGVGSRPIGLKARFQVHDHYKNVVPPTGGIIAVNGFMQAFMTQALAFGYEIAGDVLADGPEKQYWYDDLKDFMRWIVNIYGTRPSGFNWRYAYNSIIGVGTPYNDTTLNPNTTIVGIETTMDGCWQRTLRGLEGRVWGTMSEDSSEGLGFGAIAGSISGNGKGYIANMQPAVAYAKDFGAVASGAGESSTGTAAWRRHSTASNLYSEVVDCESGFIDVPQFSVVPRT